MAWDSIIIPSQAILRRTPESLGGKYNSEKGPVNSMNGLDLDGHTKLVGEFLRKVTKQIQSDHPERRDIQSGDPESKCIQSLCVFYLKAFKHMSRSLFKKEYRLFTVYNRLSDFSTYKDTYEACKSAYREIWPEEFEEIIGIWTDGLFIDNVPRELSYLCIMASEVVNPLIHMLNDTKIVDRITRKIDNNIKLSPWFDKWWRIFNVIHPPPNTMVNRPQHGHISTKAARHLGIPKGGYHIRRTRRRTRRSK